VDEAVALPIPDEAIGNSIQAVVTLADHLTLDTTALKQHCAEKLPAYMVPEKIEFRNSLPRTDNGKIDRRRLVAELTAGAK
jgi:acyl-coenzyme A synthetase/AMP-(fatty) acid ligase